jgi:ubiquitin-protein ligase E3 C
MFTTSFNASDGNGNNNNSDKSSLSSSRPHPSTTSKSILSHIPFVVPFKLRVAILRNRINSDRGMDTDWMAPRVSVKIRRQFMFEDGYALLNGMGKEQTKKKREL